MPPKRGLRAWLYDTVQAAKAVASGRIPRGEAGMALMVGPGYGGGGTTGGWSRDKAEQVRHFRGWVYRCVDFIASQVSDEPPAVVLAADPGERAKYFAARKAFASGRLLTPPAGRWMSPWERRKAIGPTQANEEYEYLNPGHPLCELLSNPNGPDTGHDLWYELATFIELTGEGYLWVVRDGAGRPVELWVIPSHWVVPIVGTDRLIERYDIMPRGGSSAIGGDAFDPDELIQFRRPSPANKIRGHSPLQAQESVVDAYELTEESRARGMVNGVSSGGVLRAGEDSEQLTDDILTRVQNRFSARYAGTGNAGVPVILGPGWEWTPPQPGQELAYLQSLDQLRRYLMAGYGLSESVLGITNEVNRAASVAALYAAHLFVVKPRTKRLAATLTEKLAREFDPRFKVFWKDTTPIDPDARRLDFQAAPPGTYSPNDYRTHVLELEPYDDPDYDLPWVPPGIGPYMAGGWDGGGAGLPGMGLPRPEQPDEPDSPLDAMADDVEADADKAYAAKARDASGHEHGSDGRFGSGGGKKPGKKPKKPAGDGASAGGGDHAAAAKELAGKIKEHGPRALAAAKAVKARVGEIASALAAKCAERGISAETVLGKAEDYGNALKLDKTNALVDQFGVSPQLAATVASHVLAYGLVKLRQHLGSKGKAMGDDEGGEDIARELLADIIAGMGLSEEAAEELLAGIKGE